MSKSEIAFEPGTNVTWKLRTYEVHGFWSSKEALLRDAATGKTHVAPMDELEPVIVEHAAALPPPRDLNDEDWDKLIRRFNAVASLAAMKHPSRAEYARVASDLNTSESTLRRWVKKYQRTGTVSALVRNQPGPRPGTRRLDQAVEELIQNQIRSRWLTREEPSQAEFIKSVQRLARKEGLKTPSGKAIRVRLRNLPERQATRARRGKKAAMERYQAVTGTHEVSEALGEVQIDHTLVDIIVVTDDEHREPVGRPFLTLAIDICSRAIVGYYLSLDKPDAYTLGLCIACACLPKEGLLKDLEIQGVAWPMQGRMQKVFLDNAKEHHALALRRGCDEQMIILEYRPPGLPYYGGHIERLIGTIMRRLHALPGSTRSNIKMRGDYDPADTAVLTLPELERYLVLQMLAYNGEVHSSLGMSPNRAWELGMSQLPIPPVVPPASLEFFASFMPFKRRTIRRDGIELFRNMYWHDGLEPLIGHSERLEVHYDPRDISRVLVRDPAGKLIPAHCTDPDFPKISLHEWTFVKRHADAEGRNPHEIAANDQLLNEADGIREVATKKQRKANRKRKQALRHTLAKADQTQRLHGLWPSSVPIVSEPPSEQFDPDAVSAYAIHVEE